MKRVPLKDIQAFCDQVANKFRPEKIILFGSYAYGKPRPDSDVDLMVVMRSRLTGIHQSIEILNAVDSHFAVDLIVRSPDEIRKRLRWNDFFLQEIMHKGKVLYESLDTRVD